MQYPLNDSDNESDKDYSKAALITERPRKLQAPREPIKFAFDDNKNYKN